MKKLFLSLLLISTLSLAYTVEKGSKLDEIKCFLWNYQPTFIKQILRPRYKLNGEKLKKLDNTECKSVFKMTAPTRSTSPFNEFYEPSKKEYSDEECFLIVFPEKADIKLIDFYWNSKYSEAEGSYAGVYSKQEGKDNFQVLQAGWKGKYIDFDENDQFYHKILKGTKELLIKFATSGDNYSATLNSVKIFRTEESARIADNKKISSEIIFKNSEAFFLKPDFQSFFSEFPKYELKKKRKRSEENETTENKDEAYYHTMYEELPGEISYKYVFPEELCIFQVNVLWYDGKGIWSKGSLFLDNKFISSESVQPEETQVFDDFKPEPVSELELKAVSFPIVIEEIKVLYFESCNE